MGFVLEHVNPWFFHAIDVYFGLDGASVDFFTFIKVANEVMLLEVFGRNGTEVHQGHRLHLAIRIDIFTQFEVFVIHLLYEWIFDGYISDFGIKGGVTAVVRPIGINNLKFGFGWVTTFFYEVCLQVRKVIHIHG